MGKLKITEVDEISINPKMGETFLIRGNGISDFTHGIFKYPCKFIPHIPRWFIKKYGNKTTAKYGILDPFVGSGTTLVESSLLGMPSFGVDIDPLSCLLSKVKTETFSRKDLDELEKVVKQFQADLEIKKITTKELERFIPKFNNLNHWFSDEAINDLAKIKYLINFYFLKNKNSKINRFLNITLASIIRKASRAEEQSPKPYISTRIKKQKTDTKKIFLKYLLKYFGAISLYSSKVTETSAKIIGHEARNIEKNKLINGKAHLAMTSPPYINAFDYVRSLKLENFWLELLQENDLPKLYDLHVGTEKISSVKYSKEMPKTGVGSLDKKIAEIYKLDKKRAHVVADFFNAMADNLEEIYKILIKGGSYCIVVGDSQIKGIHLPTSRILIDIAKKKKFTLIEDFSYIIRNRYLRIPRQGRGGFIPKDYVIVLKK